MQEGSRYQGDGEFSVLYVAAAYAEGFRVLAPLRSEDNKYKRYYGPGRRPLAYLL